MRNEKNWSPKKMWINGMINPVNQSQVGVYFDIDPEMYGIDDEGPLPLEAESMATVVVP